MVLQAEIKQLTVYILHCLECEHAGVNGMKNQRSTIQGSITKPNQKVFLPRGAEREWATTSNCSGLRNLNRDASAKPLKTPEVTGRKQEGRGTCTEDDAWGITMTPEIMIHCSYSAYLKWGLVWCNDIKIPSPLCKIAIIGPFKWFI